MGLSPQGAVTGDFNNDGKPDFVLFGFAGNPVNYVFLGNGDGTFRQMPPFLNSSVQVMKAVAADLNGDGKLDLAVVLNAVATQGLAVLLGNGDGTFQPPVYYPTDNFPTGGLAVADLNGDGILDLVATANQVDVYLGNGDGTFRAPVYSNGGQFPVYVVTGDFNGDGKVDLAVADDLYLSILLGNGDGTFQSPVTVADGGFPTSVAAGDLNQDGVTDLLTGNGSGSLILSRPLASFFPAFLNFAPQAVETESLPLTLTVTNVGTGALSFSNILTIGEYGTTNNCSGNVNRGGQCTLDVTFTPASPGPQPGTISFTDNTAMGSQVIPLFGIGGVPTAILSTSSLTFASQLVGTESGAQTITLTNSGTLALAIVSIGASGDFAQTDTCESTLNAGASCAINVMFTPTVPGKRTGSISVTDDAIGSPQSVTLTGTGAEPIVSLSPPPTFSSEMVGTTSSSQTVTLTNTGSANLSFTAIGTTGPFAIAASGTTCSTSNAVVAAATCTVAVTFTPTAGGSAAGGLSFTDNAPSSPQTVALNGTGEDFSFAPPSGSSTSATVAPGSPATYTLSVGGEGGLSGTVNFTCTGAPSEATCAVSPNSATLGSSVTNVTVTITTAAPSSTAPLSRPLPPVAPLLPGVEGLLMLSLALAAIAWAVKHWDQPASRGQSIVALLAAGLLLTLALAGCGGGGGGGGPAPNPGTPAGTYTVTVTGTTGSGSSVLSHTVTLTLTVS